MRQVGPRSAVYALPSVFSRPLLPQGRSIRGFALAWLSIVGAAVGCGGGPSMVEVAAPAAEFPGGFVIESDLSFDLTTSVEAGGETMQQLRARLSFLQRWTVQQPDADDPNRLIVLVSRDELVRSTEGEEPSRVAGSLHNRSYVVRVEPQLEEVRIEREDGSPTTPAESTWLRWLLRRYAFVEPNLDPIAAALVGRTVEVEESVSVASGDLPAERLLPPQRRLESASATVARIDVETFSAERPVVDLELAEGWAFELPDVGFASVPLAGTARLDASTGRILSRQLEGPVQARAEVSEGGTAATLVYDGTVSWNVSVSPADDPASR